MSIENSVEEKKGMSLYGMTAELAQMEALMNSDEFADQDEATQEIIADKMNSLVVFITEKTDAVCGYNQSMDDFIDAIDNRVLELKQLKEKSVNKQKNFHKYILAAMDTLKTPKITGKLYSISYRKPLQSVEILNENDIPTKYIKMKEVIDIDKKSISDDLKEGQLIAGAQLKTGERKLSFKAGK